MSARQRISAATAAAAVAWPVAGSFAETRAATAKTTANKFVATVSRSVNGATAQANRWGAVQLVVSYTKTTMVVKGRRRVRIRLTKVTAPVFPNHTDRSAYISSQAIPLLEQETLQLQPSHGLAGFRLVSGATDTSYAFAESLQAALLAMGK